MTKKQSRRDFLRFVSQLGIATALGKLLRFLPEAQVAFAQQGPWNPFQDMTIQHSREVKAKAKEKLIASTLKGLNVRNVLDESLATLDLAEAKAAVHTLTMGNTLTAVVAPTSEKDAVFVSYQLAEPRHEPGKKQGGRFSSQAALYAIEGESAKLRAMSVNGSLVSFDTANPVLNSDPCGGCVSPIYGPWSYYSEVCTDVDMGCVAFCCSEACLGACYSGPEACIACLLL